MKIITLFISLIFVVNISKSQNTNPADTIEYARSLAYEKHFDDADKLLTRFNLEHKDINALRLHAQVLYWMKKFDRSTEVFERTISNFPNIDVVKLDYGRLLFEWSKLKKSQALLNDFITTDKLNVEANLLLSYIDMSAGHNTRAKQKADVILKQYPDNKDAISILNQINTYTAPYISFGANFQSDDQPKSGLSSSVETGVYRSWILSPMLKGQFNNFIVNNSSHQSSWIQVGNKISWQTGSYLNLAGGVFQHIINSGNNYFTGSIGITQKFSRHFSGEAGYERRPYQFSAASIKKSVLENVLSVAVGFNNPKNWLGKAGFQGQNFAVGKINTIYLWLLAPLVTQKKFKAQAGYAFTYANADKNNFFAKQPLSTLINSTALYGRVPGIYDPYFTPQNQKINSLLASINIDLSKKVHFSTHTSIAVFGQADIPDLVLDKNADNQYYINKFYSLLKYFPMDWVSNLQLNLSPKFSIQLHYTYQELLFYNNNQGGIQLKYNFIHDKAR